MGLAKGVSAIEQSEKQEAAARKAAYAADRIDYLKIEPDGVAYVRLVTPASEWIKVAQHNYVKTKPAPEGVKSWPKGMSAVCRNDRGLGYNDCYICAHSLPSAGRNEFAKPSSRCWALGVLREQVRGDGSEALGGEEMRGKLLGYRNVLEEYEILDADKKPTGKKAERLALVILNFTWKQLFATLAHAEENYVGGVLGRDFKIMRSGSGTDTEYSVLAMDPAEEDAEGTILKPGSPGWQLYTDELKRRGIDPDDQLEKLILEQASELHYARWFNPNLNVDKDGKIVPASGSSAGAAVPAPASASDDVSPEHQERMAAMKAKLLGG